MMQTIYKSCPAMATRFEGWLVGEEAEHLEAVGQLVMDEIRRVERLLSRYDAAAEVARLNREAGRQAVQVSVELMGCLQDALSWYRQTDGYFDVAVGGAVPYPEAVVLHAEPRTVQYTRPDVVLDFGGYGKGYALDRAGAILNRYGVAHGLLHGGTSSVWASGRRGDGTPWPLVIKPPFGEAPPLHWSLADEGFSTSGVFGLDAEPSDLIDPHTGRAPTQQAVCAVFAATALAAEVWSTACVAMGAEKAAARLKTGTHAVRAAWIHPEPDGEVTVTWLHPTATLV